MTKSNAPESGWITVEELEHFCVTALLQTGVSPIQARTTTEVLVTTDTFGVFTHGVKNLRGYVRRIREGGIRTNVSPSITGQGSGWALIDGASALGMVTSSFAMSVAIESARMGAISYVGVRNSCHFGAAGFYALQAARANMIGLVVCNDKPSVAAPGSRGPVLGSNPLAYAVPAGAERPIFMDIATSAVAGGKVYQAQVFGRAIPPGWLIDEEGVPTTDPTGFPGVKTLMPMAAHKGYGFGLFAEVLSALLTGARTTHEVGSWMIDEGSLATGHGAAFIAINVEALIPIADFKSRVDSLIREIHNAPLAKGAERVYLPGEIEWENRERALRDGLELPGDARESLANLAKDLQIDLPRFGSVSPKA